MKLGYLKKILVLSLAFLLAFTSVPGIGSAFAETENTGSDAAEPVKSNDLEESEEGVEPSETPETFKVYFKASKRGDLKVTVFNSNGEVDRIEELSDEQEIELEYPLGIRVLVEATDDKDNGQVFESFTIKVDGKGKPHRVEGNQGDLLEFFFGQNFDVNDNTQGIIDYVSTWKSDDDDDDDDDDDVIPNELPLITAPDLTLDVSENPWNVMTGVVVSDLEDDQDPQKETVVVVRENDQAGQILENLDISQPGVYVLFYTATDSDGGSAQVLRTVTVNEAPKVDNLFITVDDYYNIWFNGSHIGSGDVGSVVNLGKGDGDKKWKSVDAYSVTVEDENLIAVKGWDQSNGTATISGFIAKLVLDDNQSELTDGTWMYTLTEPTVHEGKYWYEPDYTGGQWSQVTEISNTYYTDHWTAVSDYSLVEGANWIWSPDFVGGQFDSPVWFRNIVKYKVTFAAGERGTFDDQISIVQKGASTPQAPVVSGQAGYSFAGWSPEVAGTVTESVVYTAQWTANENILSYNGNGNTLGQAPQSQDFTTGDSALVAGQGDLEKEGYAYSGWNTQADGNGTSYSPDDSITGTDDIELFAQWTANENTLTYNGNGNTSGQAPQSQGFLTDENVSVASEGDLEKEGYTFIGWNTQADGNGTSYSPSDSITGTDDIELFAQWTVNENTLTYNGNGNTLGQAPQSQDFLTDENVSVASEGDLEKEGYTFIGWNTQADGNGTSYSPSDSITGTDDIELFAQWTANENTLTYNGNGNTLGQAPQSQGFLTDENVSVASEGDLEKEGYTFIGWNTQADGNGTSYSPSDSITGTDDIELFAQWTANENALTYNGNGNTSGQAPQSQDFLTDENVSVASEGDLEKEGYTFIGWNTQADGNGTSYSPSDSITGKDDIELFAQWTLDPYVIITDTEGSEIGSEGVTLYIGTAYTASQGQSQLQAEVVADQQILDTTWEIVSGSNNITLSSNGLVEGILATSGTPAVVRVNVVLSDESVISDEVNVIVIRGDLPVNPPVDPPTPTPTPTPTVSISLDRNPVELEYGSDALEELLSYDLTETITGSSDLNVEWTIEDPDIATVDQNGLVTALEQGETTVTVRHIASGATASSTVIVFLVGEEESPLGAVQFFDPYIIGYPDQTFGPQRPVTRAEVATMFARILNLNLDFPGSPKYKDVNEGIWYYGYIQASTRAGLFDGYADGTFKPDAPITRGEIATVFSKYWDFLDIRVNALPTNALSDVDGSHWASDYIYKMYNTGIVKGFEDGSYRPNSNTLREQVVGMINTLIARPEFFPENTKYLDITKNHWAFGNIEAATTPYSAQNNLPIIDEEN